MKTFLIILTLSFLTLACVSLEETTAPEQPVNVIRSTTKVVKDTTGNNPYPMDKVIEQ